MNGNGNSSAFYVSTQGNDSWSGKLAEPAASGADGPFATLAGARDAVRQLKQSGGLPHGGVTIFLRAGSYRLNETFTLNSEDSGTADAPVVYRAHEGENVRVTGGVNIDPATFKPVSDPQVLQRLAEPVRYTVLQCDLRALGINDFGSLSSRGFNRPVQTSHLELFCDGKPMTIAQWPDSGDFARITDVPEDALVDDGHGTQVGKLEAGFYYDGDRPSRWKSFNNVWMHGYWCRDWANSYERIDSINFDTGLIKTKPPHGLYCFRKGQRFYFLNVLEELDQPGEYYVDTEAGILYFLPPEPLYANTEITVSLLPEPLVTLDGVSHVCLRDFTLEATRSHAVVVTGGSDNTIAGCTIRNLGNWGVQVNGGTNHRVTACEICNTGDGAISISGGNRKTLTPANHSADNNHLHDYGRWSRSYQAGVRVAGVGHRVAHNLIHDAPHNAVLYNGNEIIIEFNEIYKVCMESGDVGAIYTGRDYTYRGNAVRYNYIRDIGGINDFSSAIYMDDAVSGHEIRGNIVIGGDGIWLGGGCDFIIENNIFIECRRGIKVDARGLAPGLWKRMIYDTMLNRLKEMNWRQPPYSTRYPELAALVSYYEKDDGIPPFNNRIAHNIAFNGGWLSVGWNAKEEWLELENNLVDIDPLFVDAQNGDFRLKNDSPALKLGFQQIPVGKIGLQIDEYRKHLTD